MVKGREGITVCEIMWSLPDTCGSLTNNVWNLQRLGIIR